MPMSERDRISSVIEMESASIFTISDARLIKLISQLIFPAQCSSSMIILVCVEVRFTNESLLCLDDVKRTSNEICQHKS